MWFFRVAVFLSLGSTPVSADGLEFSRLSRPWNLSIVRGRISSIVASEIVQFRDEIGEWVIFGNGEVAIEALPQSLQILLGQKPYRDNAICHLAPRSEVNSVYPVATCRSPCSAERRLVGLAFANQLRLFVEPIGGEIRVGAQLISLTLKGVSGGVARFCLCLVSSVLRLAQPLIWPFACRLLT